MLLPNSAYAYKTQKSCEEAEGTGKCCDLGAQAGGGRHWGKCSYNCGINIDKERIDKERIDKERLDTKDCVKTPKPSATPTPSR